MAGGAAGGGEQRRRSTKAPLHVILHSGLGGSTLLARALAQPGVVTTLKEPPILTDMVAFGLRNPEAQARGLLRLASALLSRPFARWRHNRLQDEQHRQWTERRYRRASGQTRASCACKRRLSRCSLRSRPRARKAAAAHAGYSWGSRMPRMTFAQLDESEMSELYRSRAGGARLAVDPADDRQRRQTASDRIARRFPLHRRASRRFGEKPRRDQSATFGSHWT